MLDANILERASKVGLEMIRVGDRVEARKGTKIIAFSTTAEAALAKANERLEEDRLRNLDKLPEDREPILVIKPRKRVKKAKSEELPPEELPPSVVEAVIDQALDKQIVGESLRAPKVGIIKGSIIKNKYKDRYKKNGFSCGDFVADELRQYLVILVNGRSKVDLVRLKLVAVTNSIWRDSYAALNAGQQRMNVGNRLRAKYLEGVEIDIGGCKFTLEFEGT